jgi:hypothetical protein
MGSQSAAPVEFEWAAERSSTHDFYNFVPAAQADRLPPTEQRRSRWPSRLSWTAVAPSSPGTPGAMARSLSIQGVDPTLVSPFRKMTNRRWSPAPRCESDVLDGVHGLVVWAIGALLLGYLAASSITGLTKSVAGTAATGTMAAIAALRTRSTTPSITSCGRARQPSRRMIISGKT